MIFDTPDLYTREIFRLLSCLCLHEDFKKKWGQSSLRPGSTRHGSFCCQANSADGQRIFFLSFPKKISKDVSCKFSPNETMSIISNRDNVKTCFFEKKKKKKKKIRKK